MAPGHSREKTQCENALHAESEVKLISKRNGSVNICKFERSLDSVCNGFLSLENFLI